MSFDSWSGIFSRQRWAEWWVRRRQAKKPSMEECAANRAEGPTERAVSNLLASCQEITILGSDAWPALVRELSRHSIELMMVQPFPPGIFLGVQLEHENGTPGGKLLVKVLQTNREPGSNTWVLSCAVLRELPTVTPPNEVGWE